MTLHALTACLLALALALAPAPVPACVGGDEPAPARARPTLPPQPAAGPGGAQYRHAALRASVHGAGDGEVWLFEPAEPAPERAPLVVFLHGWGATSPHTYGAWIEHLVRRGSVVVFPRYQASVLTPPGAFAPNALAAVATALALLDGEGHVHPDRERCAVVGHSVGGLLAANSAAQADDFALPAFRAVMAVQPGPSTGRRFRVPLADLARIPPGTLLLTIAGDADRVVGDKDAERIWRRATRVPAADKAFLVVRSQTDELRRLVADHTTPVAYGGSWISEDGRLSAGLLERVRELRASRRASAAQPDVHPSVNALDYLGYWRLFDALCAAAFDGAERALVLEDTPARRSLGVWSDGVPLVELEVRG